MAVPAAVTRYFKRLGLQRWKGKTLAEKRAHAMRMVKARRRKRRGRARRKT